jgi:hypothetical protein
VHLRACAAVRMGDHIGAYVGSVWHARARVTGQTALDVSTQSGLARTIVCAQAVRRHSAFDEVKVNTLLMANVLASRLAAK